MATASVHIPDPGKSLRDITHGVEGGLHDVKHAAAAAEAVAMRYSPPPIRNWTLSGGLAVTGGREIFEARLDVRGDASPCAPQSGGRRDAVTGR